MTRFAAPAAADAAPTRLSHNGPTGTNVQEAGVDEPDIAKLLDGYVVTTRKHSLVVTDVSGDEPVVVGEVDLPKEYWSYELMVVGDRVVVTGAGGGGYWGGRVMIDAVVPYGWGGTARSSITTIDAADPSDPTVVDQRYVDGTISTSRGARRNRADCHHREPGVEPEFVYPGEGMSRKEALERNREIVTGSTAQDWLPTSSPVPKRQRWRGRRAGRLLRCQPPQGRLRARHHHRADGGPCGPDRR